MRAFIAIDLPLYLKEYLKNIQDNFRKYNLNVKWVKQNNLHITLKFLGNTPEELQKDIEKIIEETVHEYYPIEVELKEFGYFPNQKYPRVFFVSTTQEEKLREISLALEERLEKLGFPREGRFKSHITLARIKTPKNIKSLVEETERISLEGKFFVEEITFFKSILTPLGPLYEELFKTSLKQEER